MYPVFIPYVCTYTYVTQFVFVIALASCTCIMYVEKSYGCTLYLIMMLPEAIISNHDAA